MSKFSNKSNFFTNLFPALDVNLPGTDSTRDPKTNPVVTGTHANSFVVPSDTKNIFVNRNTGVMYAVWNIGTNPLTGLDFSTVVNNTNDTQEVKSTDLVVSDLSLINQAKDDASAILIGATATLKFMYLSALDNLVPILDKDGDLDGDTYLVLLLNRNLADMKIEATDLSLYTGADANKKVQIVKLADNSTQWVVGNTKDGMGGDLNDHNVHMKFAQGLTSINDNVYVSGDDYATNNGQYKLSTRIDNLVTSYKTKHDAAVTASNVDPAAAAGSTELLKAAIDGSLFGDYDRTFIKVREQFDEEIASKMLTRVATTIDDEVGTANDRNSLLDDLTSSADNLKAKMDLIGIKKDPLDSDVTDDSVQMLLHWTRCFVPQPSLYNAAIQSMFDDLNDITGGAGDANTLKHLRQKRQDHDNQLLSMKSAIHATRVMMKSSGDSFASELTNIITESNKFIQQSLSAFEGEVIRKQVALNNMMYDLSCLQAKLHYSQQKYKVSATEMNKYYSWYVNNSGLVTTQS